jgi:class 3 adenylate cyclase
VEPSREIRDLLFGIYHDFATGDVSLIHLISEHDGVVTIGTDPGEWVIGGRETKAVFLEGVPSQAGIAITAGDVRAFAEGSVGWVSDNPVFTAPDGSAIPGRITVVFHREPDGWKVVQMHASIGAKNVDTIGRELADVEAILAAVSEERPDLTHSTSPDGTITILFTDMESSTATNEALGDDRFLPLLLRHNDIVRAQTRAAAGTVVKSMGDGFMLAFTSARRGVECAIGIQREVSALDGPIYVRMGLHTGEPVRHADDFYGRDVAYAARLGAAARGGEILVSSLVMSLVEPSGSFSFEGPRELELKGFEGPQPTFNVLWR